MHSLDGVDGGGDRFDHRRRFPVEGGKGQLALAGEGGVVVPLLNQGVQPDVGELASDRQLEIGARSSSSATFRGGRLFPVAFPTARPRTEGLAVFWQSTRPHMVAFGSTR